MAAEIISPAESPPGEAPKHPRGQNMGPTTQTSSRNKRDKGTKRAPSTKREKGSKTARANKGPKGQNKQKERAQGSAGAATVPKSKV